MIDVLIEKIRERENPTVAGLDPRIEYLPQYLRTGDDCADILAFNKALIDALWDIVPAVKPQSAYYEMLGYRGAKVLYDTICYAREKGMYVILDVKRNDIGATASAYAQAYIGKDAPYPADGVTVSPYLGSDGILPFTECCGQYGKTAFVLVKTSNKSSGELQDLTVDGKTIYETVAGYVEKWGENTIGKYGYSAVGAVVGATYPEQMKKLRAILPRTYFLVPGYGAQGGGGREAALAFRKDGLGAIVNSSRGIMCAWQKEEGCASEDFAGAARREAVRMRDDIMRAVKEGR